MEYQQRSYPLFSACGLNCGLCPRYQMDGKSKCPGCSGKDFLTKHPTCGLLTCCQRRGYEYCYQCEEYPCKKYDGADLTDSFITHKNQLRDMGKARINIDDYTTELNTKVAILEKLLTYYDDGRKKSFFCIAVNLLELQDVIYIWEQIKNNTKLDAPLKIRAATAVSLFRAMAEERDISLQLRKKTKA